MWVACITNNHQYTKVLEYDRNVSSLKGWRGGRVEGAVCCKSFPSMILVETVVAEETVVAPCGVHADAHSLGR